jgi:serine/threonine protein kinase
MKSGLIKKKKFWIIPVKISPTDFTTLEKAIFEGLEKKSFPIEPVEMKCMEDLHLTIAKYNEVEVEKALQLKKTNMKSFFVEGREIHFSTAGKHMDRGTFKEISDQRREKDPNTCRMAKLIVRLTNFEMNFSDLKCSDLLEYKPFKQVYKAEYKENAVVVQKFFLSETQKSSRFVKTLDEKIKVMWLLDHANIVKCLGRCIQDQTLFIVSEYCDGGSLHDLLHEKKIKLSPEKQLEYALSIAEGMEYLHTREPMIVHRDLNSKNILLKNGVPKITGFDVAQIRDTLSSSLDTQIETWNWMAPEIMKKGGQSYKEKVDVWSFGMILYELTTNTVPYHDCKNQMQLYDEVCVNKKTPPLPENIKHIHPTVLELMKQCWNWDPQQRPSFTQIVEILRKQQMKEYIQGLLQRIMSKDSDTLSAEIFKLDITRSEEVLQMVVDLIFDRAVVDHEHTERYADLCKKIHTRFRSSSKDNKEQVSKEPKVTSDFRKILLNRCQREFEQSFQNKLPTIDPSLPPEKTKQENKLDETKKRNLGNMKFIGALFINKMLSEKTIQKFIQQLIQDQSNEDNLEYLCSLLSTIGKRLDHEKAKRVMDQYFNKLKLLSQDKSLSSHIRSKIQEVIGPLETWALQQTLATIQIEPKTNKEFHEKPVK